MDDDPPPAGDLPDDDTLHELAQLLHPRRCQSPPESLDPNEPW